MNISRLQGWALIISALISVLLYFSVLTIESNTQNILVVMGVISSILFVLGVPSIQIIQPETKFGGQLGITLMTIPAIHEFCFWLIPFFAKHSLVLNNLVSYVWTLLAKIGIVYSGYILVGYLTIRARKFPLWTGWFLLVVGIYYDSTWFLVAYEKFEFLSLPIITDFFSNIFFLEIIALLGYGWTIIRNKT